MTVGVHRGKVRLEPYDPAWAKAFQDEKAELESYLDRKNIIKIYHVGSTSIPGIMAKPLIDILMVVKSTKQAKDWAPRLETHGYHLREDVPDHLMLAKGPEYNRTVHLHIGEWNEEYVNTTVLFRDYLITHPKAAADYEQLKKGLAGRYADDRKSYSASKKDFIYKVIQAAQAGKNWGEL
ncbi:MAG TPA: GrpB family protein [Candidatus Saccharimonadales bacterium]|nr:GrpB family protein [Candidatus Saccharimonadales bacterium]